MITHKDQMPPLKEIKKYNRKQLVTYLEMRGTACYDDESTAELRETAIMDWMDENGVKHCCKCSDYGEDQYSLGIYAGHYCEKHWQETGYRKEGASGFNPLDCGEAYEPEDY